ncbi:MAG: AmmeMemoRadiSam system protein A [Chloroflexota bacterium]
MDDETGGSSRPETHEREHSELLQLARWTLTYYLCQGKQPTCETEHYWFVTPAAVFVTLRRKPYIPGVPGELRGCIGQIEAVLPLYRAVQDAVIKAATIDPRFKPVKQDEMDNIRIEISILSGMRSIDAANDIFIGHDGLFIAGHQNSGLLLPEVAINFGWDGCEFIRHVCHKAGLPEDAWPASAKLFAFSTESFVEKPEALENIPRQ